MRSEAHLPHEIVESHDGASDIKWWIQDVSHIVQGRIMFSAMGDSHTLFLRRFPQIRLTIRCQDDEMTHEIKNVHTSTFLDSCMPNSNPY